MTSAFVSTNELSLRIAQALGASQADRDEGMVICVRRNGTTAGSDRIRIVHKRCP
jgi:hypothetical protein